MTDIQTWLDQGKTLADQAADHVGRLAAGDDKWTMTVPPKDTDSDIALMSLLDGRLPQALAALQAVLDMHRPSTADTGEEEILFCPKCFDVEDVGEVDTWPCTTVQAIQDAIGEPQ